MMTRSYHTIFTYDDVFVWAVFFERGGERRFGVVTVLVFKAWHPCRRRGFRNSTSATAIWSLAFHRRRDGFMNASSVQFLKWCMPRWELKARDWFLTCFAASMIDPNVDPISSANIFDGLFNIIDLLKIAPAVPNHWFVECCFRRARAPATWLSSWMRTGGTFVYWVCQRSLLYQLTLNVLIHQLILFDLLIEYIVYIDIFWVLFVY